MSRQRFSHLAVAELRLQRYNIHPDKRTQYSIHVTKGLSPVEIDWGVLIGVGRRL